MGGSEMGRLSPRRLLVLSDTHKFGDNMKPGDIIDETGTVARPFGFNVFVYHNSTDIVLRNPTACSLRNLWSSNSDSESPKAFEKVELPERGKQRHLCDRK